MTSTRYLVQRQVFRCIRHLRARGLVTTAHELYLEIVKRGFALMMLLPSARSKVKGELDQVTSELEAKVGNPSLLAPRTKK